MTAFAIDISTTTHPKPSRVRVRFMDRREAESYAKWLKRRNFDRIVSWHIVSLPTSYANAVFEKNVLYEEDRSKYARSILRQGYACPLPTASPSV